MSTRTRSPSSMNSGTWIVTPVSSVAGLVPPWAVSPRRPGSVWVIVNSTRLGASTADGSPLSASSWTSWFSTTHSSASRAISGRTESCS